MGLFECCHPRSRRRGTPDDDEGIEGHNGLDRSSGLPHRFDAPSGHGQNDGGGKCWALLVGNSSEWPLDRDTIGDVALSRALVDHGVVQPDRLVFLRDARATASNARVELERMLSRIGEGDVFLLYYGGHGETEHFCTHRRGGVDDGDGEEEDGGFWLHEEVADAMERHFRGRTAWLILDCCYSGNFHRTLRRRRRGRRGQDGPGYSPTRSDALTKWVCVMSTRADTVAGDEWTLTECFVRAITTGGRTHPAASAANVDPRYDRLTDVERFLGHASDEIAWVKCDLMTVYVHYPNNGSFGIDGEYGRLRCDDAPFLTPSGRADKESSPRPLHRFGRFESGENPTRLVCSTNNGEEGSDYWTPHRRPCWMSERWWSVGDQVYAKWRGGTPTASSSNSDNSPFLLPLWFPAKVIAIGGGRVGEERGGDDADVSVEVEFHDPMLNFRWSDHIGDGRRHLLLPEAHFSRWNESDYYSCIEAQIILAERMRRFVTYCLPVGTACSVLWEDDGMVYDATIASARDVPWDQVVVANANGGGALVAVHWDEEGTYSVVPLKHCVLKDAHDANGNSLDDDLRNFAAVRDDVAARKVDTAEQALMLGLDSSGKSLVPAASLLCDASELEGFWGGTGEWFDAHSVVDESEQPLGLRALASHIWYSDRGDYCAVRWDEDGTVALLPRKLVRKKSGECSVCRGKVGSA